MVSAMRQCRQGRSSFDPSVSDIVMPFDRNVVAENELPFHTERGLVRRPASMASRRSLRSRHNAETPRLAPAGLFQAGCGGHRQCRKIAARPPAQPENRAVWKL